MRRSKTPSPVFVSIFLVDLIHGYLPRTKRFIDHTFLDIELRFKAMYTYLYSRLLDGTVELPWEADRQRYDEGTKPAMDPELEAELEAQAWARRALSSRL